MERTTENKKIVDIRTSILNGKMIKTTHYSDGSKIVGIVSDAQVSRLVDRIEKIPDLSVVKGNKKERGSGDAMLIIIIAIVAVLFLSGGIKPNKLNEKCTSAGWFESEDCRRYYRNN